MLNEYADSNLWKNNPDKISLRSDLLVTNRVLEILGNINGKKILDAGCGNGKVSRLLAENGAKVIAFDKIQDQIDIAKNTDSKLNIEYLLGDICNFDGLNLPNDFDIIISLMTFLYLDENEFINALKQIRKHLKIGGKFIYGNIDPYRFGTDNINKTEKLVAELPTVSGELFKTTFYKHPYPFIIKAFTDLGFKIVNEIKPKETENEIIKYSMLFPKENIGKGQYVIFELEAV